MAQYNVKYSCGHDGTVSLFGKHSEREKTLKWLGTQDCPECQRKETDELPVTIELKSATQNMTGDDLFLVAVATGGTYKEKEKLKELGFRWGELQFDAGFFDMISGKTFSKCWSKNIKVVASDFDSLEALCKACGVAENKIGPYDVRFSISPVDFSLLREGLKKISEQEEADKAEAQKESERKRKIGRSPLAVFAESKGKYWNNKKYGSERSGYTIYVDNSEYKVPADVMQAQKNWYKHRDNVNAEYEPVTGGNK
jgi:hypothetical protein